MLVYYYAINLLRETEVAKSSFIFFMVLILSACAQNPFVDKRFNNKLFPYSRGTVTTILTQNKIIYDDDNKRYWKYTYFCKLVQNKIGYLEYSCDKYQLCSSFDNCDDPIKKRSEPIVAKFIVTEKKDRYAPFEDYPIVKKEIYKGNDLLMSENYILLSGPSED